jgi:hypothetical protein
MKVQKRIKLVRNFMESMRLWVTQYGLNMIANAAKKSPDLVRIKRAIAKYDLSRDTFDRAVKAGELTRYKRKRASFLDANHIDAWLMGKTEVA